MVPRTTREEEFAQSVIDRCVQHARRILASQAPQVRAGHYDFVPLLEETTTQLYLAGVMWRFGEQFDLPTEARTRGFICLMSMLIHDGLSPEKAQKQIAYLMQMARTPVGPFVVAAGYGATEGDGTLAKTFEPFRNMPGSSGAPHRFLTRSKPIAAGVAVAAFAIPFVIGDDWGVALSIAVVTGGCTLSIAWAIFQHMAKR